MFLLYCTFFFASSSFAYARSDSHEELMGIATEAQQEFALVIATTVEGKFVRMIDRTDFKFLTLSTKKNEKKYDDLRSMRLMNVHISLRRNKVCQYYSRQRL